MLDAIAVESPSAEVYVVNYAAILPTPALGWLAPGPKAAPFHPNLNGMTGIAAVVAAEVGP